MNRRNFLMTAGASVGVIFSRSASAQTPPANAQSPEAIARWIYAEAAKIDKHGSQNGGTFLFSTKSRVRGRVFSAGFLRDWNAAQARLKKSGEMGMDFDPVSNSQDPDIGRTAYAIENSSDTRTTVAVTSGFRNAPKRKPEIIRYDFIKEKDGWKVDDIRGNVENDRWSLREIMKEWK